MEVPFNDITSLPHENLPSGSKVITGGQTDKHTHRQTGDLISLRRFCNNASILVMLFSVYIIRITDSSPKFVVKLLMSGLRSYL
jgi:hypothetical protein